MSARFAYVPNRLKSNFNSDVHHHYDHLSGHFHPYRFYDRSCDHRRHCHDHHDCFHDGSIDDDTFWNS